MKLRLAAVCLLMSTLAWAGSPPKAPKPRKGDSTMNKLDEIPKMELGGQECMTKCQQPIIRCIERCDGDADCSQRCSKDLERCAKDCGLKD
ncbi:MAG: hypothetical protein JXB05_15945 [Myxococcaceae bacterium]|nr:hypothetical protein [Myxococcaceae bacterium]